jgi:hypothetical protein
MPRVIALKVSNGKFVCAENGGASPLVANRDVIGPWEQFLLVEHGPGKVALQATNGKYVGRVAGATGELLAQRDQITNDEVFDLISQGGAKVAFRHSGGRYLCAENGGGGPVLANREAVGPWETIELVTVQGRATAFNPEVHGFRFINDFQVEPVNDVRFAGQCGGMVYAALDYFNARVPVPTQTFRPAVNTPLANYIYARQNQSVFENLDKWGELFFNPFGWRTNEFFNWGLQGFNGGRLQELRTEIDAGRPAPLGLFKAGNGGAGPHHQVLALGYALGRYQGDLGQFSDDLRIFIYDPNHPNLVMTLAPSVANHSYYYVEQPSEAWMTYFVDRKYRATAPPQIVAPPPSADGLVHEILLELRTGGDDLRGGNDNVHATITFRDGGSQTAPNINGLARWINNYTQTVPIALRRPVPVGELKSVVLTTTFGGGPFGDNWNLDSFRVIAAGRELYGRSGAPLVRFTGENRPFVAELRS